MEEAGLRSNIEGLKFTDGDVYVVGCVGSPLIGKLWKIVVCCERNLLPSKPKNSFAVDDFSKKSSIFMIGSSGRPPSDCGRRAETPSPFSRNAECQLEFADSGCAESRAVSCCASLCEFVFAFMGKSILSLLGSCMDEAT